MARFLTNPKIRRVAASPIATRIVKNIVFHRQTNDTSLPYLHSIELRQSDAMCVDVYPVAVKHHTMPVVGAVHTRLGLCLQVLIRVELKVCADPSKRVVYLFRQINMITNDLSVT
jgi:hypothetical protein